VSPAKQQQQKAQQLQKPQQRLWQQQQQRQQRYPIPAATTSRILIRIFHSNQLAECYVLYARGLLEIFSIHF